MAERRARTSGLSLSDMATDGGCWAKVATGAGGGRACASVRSKGASWATDALGVMGDTGGRFGEADSERLRDRSDDDEASLDEAGRGVVSTRSAGMTAAWTTTTTRGAEPESFRRFPIGGGLSRWRRRGRARSGPRVVMGNSNNARQLGLGDRVTG
jgi:hypothetical protein